MVSISLIAAHLPQAFHGMYWLVSTCAYISLGVFYEYATSVVKNIEAISIEPVRILCVDYTANTDTLLDTPINLLLVLNARPHLIWSNDASGDIVATSIYRT